MFPMLEQGVRQLEAAAPRAEQSPMEIHTGVAVD